MSTPVTTQAQLRDAVHAEGLTFKCGDCGKIKPVQTNGGTGYGYADDSPDSPPICYECCGKRDAEAMERDGKAILYLIRGGDGKLKITNWPGTLTVHSQFEYRKSRNNFGAPRTDVWFRFNGRDWHGVNLGDSEILRCRRLKYKFDSRIPNTGNREVKP